MRLAKVESSRAVVLVEIACPNFRTHTRSDHLPNREPSWVKQTSVFREASPPNFFLAPLLPTACFDCGHSVEFSPRGGNKRRGHHERETRNEYSSTQNLGSRIRQSRVRPPSGRRPVVWGGSPDSWPLDVALSNAGWQAAALPNLRTTCAPTSRINCVQRPDRAHSPTDRKRCLFRGPMRNEGNPYSAIVRRIPRGFAVRANRLRPSTLAP